MNCQYCKRSFKNVQLHHPHCKNRLKHLRKKRKAECIDAERKQQIQREEFVQKIRDKNEAELRKKIKAELKQEIREELRAEILQEIAQAKELVGSHVTNNVTHVTNNLNTMICSSIDSDFEQFSLKATNFVRELINNGTNANDCQRLLLKAVEESDDPSDQRMLSILERDSAEGYDVQGADSNLVTQHIKEKNEELQKKLTEIVQS